MKSKIPFILSFAVLTAFCSAAPTTLKTPDALSMREAITSILKGRVVVIPGGKDGQPIITLEPFDIATDALFALGHDKRELDKELAELTAQHGDIQTANKITGRADDAHDSLVKAAADWNDALKKTPSVTVDLEPVSLEALNIVKNKFSNSDVFDGLGPILKR